MSSLNHRENADLGSSTERYDRRRFQRLKQYAVVRSATSELTAGALLTFTSSASLGRRFSELIQPTKTAERNPLFFARMSFLLIQRVKPVQCKIRQSPGLTSEK